MNRFLLLLILVPALALAACGSETGGDSDAPDEAPGSAVLLEQEPADAVAVAAARERPEGEDVTVVGRISKLMKGYAAFTLTDSALEYCGETREEACPTPWDYCCTASEVVQAGSLPVEVHDAEGNPLATSTGDLRLLDEVTVTGTLQKTESGGLMLVVRQGAFRRDRPDLPDHVQWP